MWREKRLRTWHVGCCASAKPQRSREIFALPGAGKIVGAAAQTLEGLIPSEATIKAQYEKASQLLANCGSRFVVIIDDIDRLSPDEAIEVFKLVKSVGQLSNVVYLLAFDRQLAERAVSVRFPVRRASLPGEDITSSFRGPVASAEQLQEAFLAQVDDACPQTTRKTKFGS
jgi:hypothetical protein